MLITVKEIVIDTKHIFKIGKIDRDYDYDFGYLFTISLINNSKYSVRCCEDDFSKEERSLIGDKVYFDKLNNLRNKLIEYWNKDKLSIPQLDL